MTTNMLRSGVVVEKSTDLKSMDDVKNFETLKSLVEDMQKNAGKLGIKGVFASTSLKTGEDWRWHTHLANIPVYYEFRDNNVDLSGDKTKTIDFKYSENFKNVFDLYINNSVTDKKILGSKIVDESMAEFALGQCAMVQNGNWAWSQISNVKGNVVKAEDIKYLPIYMGVNGEESQGLCVGTENFFAINAKASDAERKATEDFIYWLFSSETGKKFVVNELDLIAPFDTFNDDEKPNDPLGQEVIRWMNMENINTIPWNFTVFPSITFKNDFGAALLQYSQGSKNWNDVKSITVLQKEKKIIIETEPFADVACFLTFVATTDTANELEHIRLALKDETGETHTYLESTKILHNPPITKEAVLKTPF